MKPISIDPDMTVDEIMRRWPSTIRVMMRHRMLCLGCPIGIFSHRRRRPHDMQIGGHAHREGLIVVTNNMREFVRMPGVRVENWL